MIHVVLGEIVGSVIRKNLSLSKQTDKFYANNKMPCLVVSVKNLELIFGEVKRDKIVEIVSKRRGQATKETPTEVHFGLVLGGAQLQHGLGHVATNRRVGRVHMALLGERVEHLQGLLGPCIL